MSGGSHNYLYSKSSWDIMENLEALDRMSDDLSVLGYAEDAARETEEILCFIRHFQIRIDTRIERLSKVWRAMEWWKSADSGEDYVKEELARYRGEGKK